MATLANIIKNIDFGNTEIGSANISNIGDGSITGAISQVNSDLGGVRFGIENNKYGYYDSNGNFINFKVPTGTATVDKVLSGYTFSNDSGTGLTGRMINHEAVASTINAGKSYTVPAGYHNGNGLIRAETLANQTTVDSEKTAVTSAAMLSGYQAWVNGNKINGSITSQNALNKTLNVGASESVAAGYYPGGTLKGQTLDGNAATEHVYYGKTFYNSGSQKLTGGMTTYKTKTYTPSLADTVSIQAGYHQASTIAAAKNLLTGNAAATQVLNGQTFHAGSNATLQKGTMPNNGQWSTNTVVGLSGSGSTRRGYVGFPWGFYSKDTTTVTSHPLYNKGSVVLSTVQILDLANITSVLSGNATTEQVLSGRTFYNSTSQKLTGSIPSNSNGENVTAVGLYGTKARTDQKYCYAYFPYGYYPNSSTVTTNVAYQKGYISLSTAHINNLASAMPNKAVPTKITVNNSGTASVTFTKGIYNSATVDGTGAYNAGKAAGGAATKSAGTRSFKANKEMYTDISTFFLSSASHPAYKNLTVDSFYFTDIHIKVIKWNGDFGTGAEWAYVQARDYPMTIKSYSTNSNGGTVTVQNDHIPGAQDKLVWDTSYNLRYWYSK